jgi:integrase/recombinase XerD
MKNVLATPKTNAGNGIVELSFEYDPETIQVIKSIPGRRYHPDLKMWTIPDDPAHRKKLKTLIPQNLLTWSDGLSKTKISIMKPPCFGIKQKEAMFRFEQTLELRGYSRNTLKTYRAMFKEFLLHYQQADPARLSEEEIRAFLQHLVREKLVSRVYQNQSINAIKFYYEKVLGHERKVYYLERPKKELRYPVVLSQEEIKSIFLKIRNFKHRIALMLIYSAGLRRSELIGLRVEDMDFDRNQIWVRGGKGLKDRFTLLSKSLKPDLLKYIEMYRPQTFLIEGRNRDSYSGSSLRNILIAAVGETQIRKKVTLHTLRHSFATHLLEEGTSTRFIQELLGHNSPKTTEIYTHITRKGMEKIKSPLDLWN